MATATDPIGAKFTDLGLSDTMLDALRAAEYLEPTEIQAGLIPRVLAGADVMGQARTGTGKTAAFAIPILEMLRQERRHIPQAIILVPTRELAVQVRDETIKLSKGRRTRTVAIYGGKPIRDQIEKLRSGADIVVGTPGRVLDLIARGALQLHGLNFVVLDEADRMLDIGFRPDIEKILRHCPPQRQTLLLSATVPPPVQRLAQRYMREPESLNFSPKEISSDTIAQFYFTIDHAQKFDLLDKLVERERPRQAIVFCRTKRGTDRVAGRLAKRHKSVDCIHGDLPQTARDRVMARFRAGDVRILVATDVVGRGIDVTGISHIINYDIPQFCDDYIHRVGRTGRMSKAGLAEGVAFTFVTPEEGSELTRIEMRIDKLLTRDEMEGFQTLPQPIAAVEENPTTALEDPDKPPAEKQPPPPGKRPPRRIRRAL